MRRLWHFYIKSFILNENLQVRRCRWTEKKQSKETERSAATPTETWSKANHWPGEPWVEHLCSEELLETGLRFGRRNKLEKKSVTLDSFPCFFLDSNLSKSDSQTDWCSLWFCSAAVDSSIFWSSHGYTVKPREATAVVLLCTNLQNIFKYKSGRFGVRVDLEKQVPLI